MTKINEPIKPGQPISASQLEEIREAVLSKLFVSPPLQKSKTAAGHFLTSLPFGDPWFLANITEQGDPNNNPSNIQNPKKKYSWQEVGNTNNEGEWDDEDTYASEASGSEAVVLPATVLMKKDSPKGYIFIYQRTSISGKLTKDNSVSPPVFKIGNQEVNVGSDYFIDLPVVAHPKGASDWIFEPPATLEGVLEEALVPNSKAECQISEIAAPGSFIISDLPKLDVYDFGKWSVAAGKRVTVQLSSNKKFYIVNMAEC